MPQIAAIHARLNKVVYHDRQPADWLDPTFGVIRIRGQGQNDAKAPFSAACAAAKIRHRTKKAADAGPGGVTVALAVNKRFPTR